jgi:hypothetical protein
MRAYGTLVDIVGDYAIFSLDVELHSRTSLPPRAGRAQVRTPRGVPHLATPFTAPIAVRVRTLRGRRHGCGVAGGTQRRNPAVGGRGRSRSIPGIEEAHEALRGHALVRAGGRSGRRAQESRNTTSIRYSERERIRAFLTRSCSRCSLRTECAGIEPSELREGAGARRLRDPWYADASDLATYCAGLRRIESVLTRSS